MDTRYRQLPQIGQRWRLHRTDVRRLLLDISAVEEADLPDIAAALQECLEGGRV